MDVLHPDDGVIPEVLDSPSDLAAERGVWVGDGLFEVASYELWLLPENDSLLIGSLSEVEILRWPSKILEQLQSFWIRVEVAPLCHQRFKVFGQALA